MRIIDISLTVTALMPVWPDNPTVRLERTRKIEEGSNANVSQLSLGVHTGTHVDAPFHFVPGGSTAESLPLSVLIGPATVVYVSDADTVTASLLRAAVSKPTARLLIRTRNSEDWRRQETRFRPEFVGVREDAAEWIVASGIRLVGVDYLSVAPYGLGTPVHRILLEAGVVVVEGLDLSQVEPGDYDLWCLPLKLGGSDGAPARAVLAAPNRR